MTSDPHRHVFINLYIWKRSLPENRFWFVSSGKKKIFSSLRAQGAGDSPSTESWVKHILCDMRSSHHMSHSYKVQIVCLCTSSNPGCNTGLPFQPDLFSSLQQLVPNSGTSEYIQTSVKYAIAVCLWCDLWQAHPLFYGGFLTLLVYWIYTSHMHVLILKMAGSHFLLTSAAHLSFHTSLSQVTTGQSKCLCVRTNGWGQEGNSQFSQQCCQHIGVATSSVSPVSLLLHYAEQSPDVAQSPGYKWCDVSTAAGSQCQALCTERWTSPGSCKFATRSDKLPVTRRCRATDGMSWGNNVDCVYFCYHPLNKSD